MSASGYTPILIYASGTTTNVPLAANMTSSASGAELAINYADGKLFYKDSSGVVQVLATKATALSTVTNNGVVYVNSSGQATSGSALTFDGTNLGIGTSSPSSKLQLTGASQAATSLTMLYSAIQAGSIGINSSGSMVFGLDGSTGTTTRLNLDTSGNLGLGVTPSAWVSNRRALEIGGGASAVLALNGTAAVAEIFTNSYRNTAGTYIYAQNGYAGYMNYSSQASGGWAWSLAPSGSAGATATFTQAMTLDASGNLIVGGTSALVSSAGRGNITINGSSDSILSFGSAGTNTGYLFATTSGMELASIGNTFVRFTTNGSERARIDSSGNLLVGTTSASLNNSNSCILNVSPNAYSVTNHANGVSSATRYAYFGYNGSEIGSITQNGTTGVLYNLTSDYRLKNDQQPLTGAKEFVMALQPKKWQWWDGSGEGVGFVAHEFMEVAKYSGHGEKDAVDADGKPVYQSIQPSSSEVMANLVSLIQEQQAIIENLKARLDAANL